MRQRAGVAACLVLMAGCGAPAGGVSIEFSSRALLAQADTVVIFFYGAEVACQVVRQTVPRPPAILGPFQAAVDADGKTRGIQFTVEPIPVGEYVVFVDALDVNGGNVGDGCAPMQEVLEKEVTQIEVRVSESSS